MVGVAPIILKAQIINIREALALPDYTIKKEYNPFYYSDDLFSINVNPFNNNFGWYFNLFDSTLYSNQPHNYRGKKTNIKKIKDEIKIILNMEKRSLKFIIDNEDMGDSYNNIPIDKPLTPAILLYDSDDSIEIINC